MKKTYFYTNALGRNEKVVVNLNKVKDGKYFVTIWDAFTNDFYGSAYYSKQDITRLLNAYGIDADF